MTTRWFEEPWDWRPPEPVVYQVPDELLRGGGLIEVTAMGDKERSFVPGAAANLMATEEPGRTVINHIEPLHQPGPTVLIGPSGAWGCSCGARGFGASREDAEVALRVHRRSTLCTARVPRRTRLRKTASPPGLYDLRQAYLDAKSGAAAFTALLAFLAAVDAARSEDELDTLGDDTPVRADPACQLGAMVCVVLGLLSWAALAAGVMAGSLVLLWAVGAPSAVGAWVLGRVVTGLRHRDG